MTTNNIKTSTHFEVPTSLVPPLGRALLNCHATAIHKPGSGEAKCCHLECQNYSQICPSTPTVHCQSTSISFTSVLQHDSSLSQHPNRDVRTARRHQLHRSYSVTQATSLCNPLHSRRRHHIWRCMCGAGAATAP